MSPVAAVSHYSPNQSCIRSPNSIVVVNIQLCQSAYINFKNSIFRYFGQKKAIQSMYSFNNNRLIQIKLDFFVWIMPFSAHEIEFGQLHKFSSQQIFQVFIELFNIQSVERFKVV